MPKLFANYFLSYDQSGVQLNSAPRRESLQPSKAPIYFPLFLGKGKSQVSTNFPRFNKCQSSVMPAR
uniref:Uncharacterized protein n=1 Tax=Trichuris muris TaxID=70415 RepID=A0A5S6QGT9_TRIMR